MIIVHLAIIRVIIFEYIKPVVIPQSSVAVLLCWVLNPTWLLSLIDDEAKARLVLLTVREHKLSPK